MLMTVRGMWKTATAHHARTAVLTSHGWGVAATTFARIAVSSWNSSRLPAHMSRLLTLFLRVDLPRIEITAWVPCLWGVTRA
jgi:hypothetical protein